MKPDRSLDAGARIYRYVVRYDNGTAPCTDGGWCTLAICKPAIRANARPGDWIVGFRSRHPGEVAYVMRVAERLTLAEYWNDPRFATRRPGATERPDNLYRANAAGELVQVRNRVHGPIEAAKDLRGKHALVSREFRYFGADSVPLPNELMHLLHTTQGHAVHKARRADDVARLRAWLAAWPRGRHGTADGAECARKRKAPRKTTTRGAPDCAAPLIRRTRLRSGQ